MKFRSVLFLSAFALTACASQPPGITSWGYDGYTLSAPFDASHPEGSKKLAMMDAEDYCRSLNSTMMFLSADPKPSADATGQGTLEIVFRCPSTRFAGH